MLSLNQFNFVAESSMAGSCEISNLFSNYINAIYQQEETPPDPDLLTHLVDDDNASLTMSNTHTAMETTGKYPNSSTADISGLHTKGKRAPTILDEFPSYSRTAVLFLKRHTTRVFLIKSAAIPATGRGNGKPFLSTLYLENPGKGN